MIRPILKQDDEHAAVLNQPTKEVIVISNSVRELVEDMWDSMYAARGVGLAATQIGSSLQICVLDTPQSENSNRRLVMINPSIEEFCGEQTGEEGCLSMPGLRWDITRANSVTVTFQDLQGRKQRMSARGLLARAIQHECDHLNGVLCNSLAKETVKP